jgi:hypothetical protein
MNAPALRWPAALAAAALAACNDDEVVPTDAASADAAIDTALVDTPVFDTPIDTVVDAPAGLRCIVTPDTLTVDEGATAALMIRVSAPPQGNATANIAVSDATIVTATPASLVYTPASWDLAQVVTISGVQDADAIDDTITIQCQVAAQTLVTFIPITVNDDD